VVANYRINVSLDEGEMRALITIAHENCRHPREELRFLLRQELARRQVNLVGKEALRRAQGGGDIQEGGSGGEG
jgi:hypothetical protein